MQRIAILTMLGLFLIVACKVDFTGLQTLEVPDLAALLEQDGGVVVCDANSADTRERHGVIPGAVLLTNYRDYDAGSELPADKGARLVFYCHSDACGAAADAARKAIAAGHRNVSVLSDGITGWSASGQSVERPS